MKRNYDTVALFYDRLAGLVFGKSLVNAQVYLLNAIPAGARVLIIGGGTGWVLEEVAKIHPARLTIDYVDAAAKMIAFAEKRNAGSNKVTFITSLIQDVQFGSPGGYDIVLTPFLFDNFTDAALQQIFPVIDQQLKQNGNWLYCDFQYTGIFWQKALLRIMYMFFRLCCGVEASGLPDAATLFSRYKYRTSAQRTYMNGFVAATVYMRDQ